MKLESSASVGFIHKETYFNLPVETIQFLFHANIHNYDFKLDTL